MRVIIAAILVSCGAGILLQSVNTLFAYSRRHFHRNFHRDRIIMDTVLLMMYLLMVAFTGLMYVCAGYDTLVIYRVLAIMVSIILAAFLRYCLKNRNGFKKEYITLFAFYFSAVMYMTLVSRIGTQSHTTAVHPFHGLSNALQSGSWQDMEHFFLNVLLFLPFGFLIPNMNPVYLRRAGFSVIGGLMVSTIIEGIQMAAGLGMCDIDDIIANAAGAAIGYGAWSFLQRVRKNWRL